MIYTNEWEYENQDYLKEQFERKLTEQDKQILRMRMDGCSLKEIAAAVGFKTPSATSKHIEKSPVLMRIMCPASTVVF